MGKDTTIKVLSSDNDKVISTELRINGEEVEISSEGRASFTAPDAGKYTVKFKAVDSAGNEAYYEQELIAIKSGDEIAPTVAIHIPQTGNKITSPTDIFGTVEDENLVFYRLEYSIKDMNEFIVFAEGNKIIENGILGRIDPTIMKNGMYDVRLTACDHSGNKSTTEVVYHIEGEMKVGNFSISFNDLTIPVSGIPITINRNYDSRNKNKGDFGIGWTLGIQDIKILENYVPGEHFTFTTKSAFMGIPYYYLTETKEHTVTVAFPDGRVDEFGMEFTPNNQPLSVFNDTSVSYIPKNGTKSKLISLDDNNCIIMKGVTDYYLIDWNFNTYNPDRYMLTTQDGTQYIINQNTGLESIKDPNGNTITFGENGIIHSDGKGINFKRDSQGRIVEIIDPKENTIKYEYDYYGDLVSVTDQVGNITRYKYNYSHGLLDVIDPRGVKYARNEYDDEGRLVAQIDAQGNKIEYSRDISAKQEIVKDRLGNVTVFNYDDKGNVLSKFDALGNKTSFTYDESNNKLTETDAKGNVKKFTYDSKGNMLSFTDPLGNTMEYTYNTMGQELTHKNPMGIVTKNEYDKNGNLTSSEGPDGQKTLFTSSSKGIESITDSLGNVKKLTYDTYGNVKTETDLQGNVKTYTYDLNGNKTSTAVERTVASGKETITTYYEYDSMNRVVKVIDPYGYEVSCEYNYMGKETAVIDKFGNRTEYEYDMFGNLLYKMYPDKSVEGYTYDEEGRTLHQQIEKEEQQAITMTNLAG